MKKKIIKSAEWLYCQAGYLKSNNVVWFFNLIFFITEMYTIFTPFTAKSIEMHNF